MSGLARKLTATAVAVALVGVPTGAIAASPPAVAAPVQATAAPVNPWLSLSAMTSTSSSAAATAAAAQGEDGPGWPPILPLIVIAATIALAIYILLKDDGDDDLDFTPISP